MQRFVGVLSACFANFESYGPNVQPLASLLEQAAHRIFVEEGDCPVDRYVGG